MASITVQILPSNFGCTNGHILDYGAVYFSNWEYLFLKFKLYIGIDRWFQYVEFVPKAYNLNSGAMITPGPTDAKMKAQDVYHTMVNYEDRNPSIDYYRYRVIAVLLTVLKKYCV